jgi:hypothetical protein
VTWTPPPGYPDLVPGAEVTHPRFGKGVIEDMPWWNGQPLVDFTADGGRKLFCNPDRLSTEDKEPEPEPVNAIRFRTNPETGRLEQVYGQNMRWTVGSAEGATTYLSLWTSKTGGRMVDPAELSEEQMSEVLERVSDPDGPVYRLVSPDEDMARAWDEGFRAARLAALDPPMSEPRLNPYRRGGA